MNWNRSSFFMIGAKRITGGSRRAKADPGVAIIMVKMAISEIYIVLEY
jgi:hypothetical protein